MNENNNEVNNTVNNNTVNNAPSQEVPPVTPQEGQNNQVVGETVQQPIQQPSQQVQQTSSGTTSSSQPQVVKVVNTKEVVKEVTKPKNEKTSQPKQAVSNQQPVSDASQPQQTAVVEEKPKKKKKGHPIFSIFLILCLFAFVFFLPQITNYVTAYLEEKNGGNEVDGSMKSGTMTCSLSQQFENGSSTVDITFTYVTNKLKKTSTQTNYRLADTAPDNTTLVERQTSCEHLEEVLSGVEGMDADCNQTVTVQTTIQNVDYKKLDLDYLNENIAEFEGFMPEYELDKNVSAIKLSLEQAGYTCKAREH